jgi:hypothetical protein
VKHASSCTSSTTGRRVRRVRHAGWLVAGALVLAACGGGDDDADSSTTTTTLAPAAETTSTVAAATTTIATTTVPVVIDLVTEGATVVVANSSNINGAAGRMSDRLAIAGFTMGEPTNGSEGQLEITKIYFDPANENAQPVAESVRAALGGGDIQLFEMGVPAPVESGDIGDATIVVSMGNDTADKSLEELQGLVVPAETPDDTDDTTDDTTDDGDDTTDDTTDDGDDTTETSEPESDG